jgi:acetylornithine deacetylase/succinyl-diaminopimelate desuccinylase-like protein
MSAIDHYLEAHAAQFEEELCEFLRIPSISADPKRRDDMHRAADWVADQFRRMRFSTEVISTAGHPMVYAESPAVPGAPTALVYGHYDVQPVDDGTRRVETRPNPRLRQRRPRGRLQRLDEGDD